MPNWPYPSRAEGVAGSFGPAHGQPHRFSRFFVRCRILRAFVECHGDGGVQQVLNFGRAFRRQFHTLTVDVTGKGHAFLIQLPQTGQRHDLKAARIGEDRARPVHEFVQAAKRGDPLGARAQHQVIGVAQNDRRAGRFDRCRQHRLDRARGADRHENRRLEGAVGGLQPATSRAMPSVFCSSKLNAVMGPPGAAGTHRHRNKNGIRRR